MAAQEPFTHQTRTLGFEICIEFQLSADRLVLHASITTFSTPITS